MFQPHKRPTVIGSAFVLLLALTTVTSCSTPQGTTLPATSNGSGSASPTASASGTGTANAGELCGPGSAITYNTADFQQTPKLDNKWFPLKPGSQYTTTGDVKSA